MSNPLALRALRTKAKLRTRLQAATFLGVTENTVYRWETGRVPVPKMVTHALEQRIVMQKMFTEIAGALCADCMKRVAKAVKAQ